MSLIFNKLGQLGSDQINNKEENNPMLSKDNDMGSFDAASAGTKNDSLLSVDASFSGSINFKSFLRIDGKFEGEISSKGTLFVGRTGVVKAAIKVGNMIVEGKIQGNVTATDKVDLRQSAQLMGDIKASKLSIAEGVSFVGNCDVNPSNEKLDFSSNDEKGPVSIDRNKDKIIK